MSDHAFDFLQSWIVENVNATRGASCSGLHLGSPNKGHSITKADLNEAAGGDLDAYIFAELNSGVDRTVEDRIPQGVS
jgi:hypothetical protein